MKRLVIVAGSTARNPPGRDGKLPAEKAYARYQFERRRDYARKFGAGWLIFSAKWGLLAPSELIDPTYVANEIISDEDLLLAQLRQHRAEDYDVIEVLAGKEYVDRLQGPARAIRVRLATPLLDQGMGMGQQSAEIGRRILFGEPFSI